MTFYNPFTQCLPDLSSLLAGMSNETLHDEPNTVQVSPNDSQPVENPNSTVNESVGEFPLYNKPVIRVFGHGWDPTDSDDDLMYPGFQKVSPLLLDGVEVYGLGHRNIYVECQDDDPDVQVVKLPTESVPNLMVSIANFKDTFNSDKYKFGIWMDNVNYTPQWLECYMSVFTLRELLVHFNQLLPRGYYLQLNTSRVPLRQFDAYQLPKYVGYTTQTNDYLREYLVTKKYVQLNSDCQYMGDDCASRFYYGQEATEMLEHSGLTPQYQNLTTDEEAWLKNDFCLDSYLDGWDYDYSTYPDDYHNPPCTNETSSWEKQVTDTQPSKISQTTQATQTSFE